MVGAFRASATARRRRGGEGRRPARPGATCRWPGCRSRSRRTPPVAGLPTWNGSAAARTAVAEARPRGGPAAARRRRGRRRHDPDAGAGPLGDHRRRDGGDPQPVGARPYPRRVLRRRGRRGGRRAGADRARQRRARLDPHPGRLLRAGRAQAGPRRGARASSASTTGSAWSSTACSPPRWPTRRSASRCWPAARPAKLVRAGPAADRRLAALAGRRRPRRTRPTARRVAAAGEAAGRRRARHGAGRPGYPTAAAACGHRHLVRRGRTGTPRPPGWTVAALQPRTRRHVALGEWAWRRGYVREARPRAAWRERSIGFFADRAVRRAAHPGAGRPRRRRPHGWSAPVLAGQHGGQHPVRPVRRRRGTSPACRRSSCRSASARTGCRSPCSWSARPARSCCCSRVAGQFEVAAPVAAARPRLRRAWHASLPATGLTRATLGCGARRRRRGLRSRRGTIGVTTGAGQLADVEAARELLAGVVRTTPLEPCRPLTATLGGPAWLKCENLQRAGSYKVRGAYVRISRLSDGGAGPRRGRGQRRQPRPGRGAGRRPARHARPPSSCRWARRCRRSPPPRGTAPRSSCVGNTVDEALVAAQEFAERTGAVLIHPFDHPDVIAGQGTVGAGDPRAVPGRAARSSPGSAAAG